MDLTHELDRVLSEVNVSTSQYANPMVLNKIQRQRIVAKILPVIERLTNQGEQQ